MTELEKMVTGQLYSQGDTKVVLKWLRDICCAINLIAFQLFDKEENKKYSKNFLVQLMVHHIMLQHPLPYITALTHM